MELEEEGTSRFLGKEVDIEINACDETKPAAGMVLTTADMSGGGGGGRGGQRKSSVHLCVLDKSFHSSAPLFSHL